MSNSDSESSDSESSDSGSYDKTGIDKFFEDMADILVDDKEVYAERLSGWVYEDPKGMYRYYWGVLSTAIDDISEKIEEKITEFKNEYSDKPELSADDIKKIKTEMTDYMRNKVFKDAESKYVIDVFEDNRESLDNLFVKKMKKYCHNPAEFMKEDHSDSEYSESEPEKE